jgi:hypothetical protein
MLGHYAARRIGGTDQQYGTEARREVRDFSGGFGLRHTGLFCTSASMCQAFSPSLFLQAGPDTPVLSVDDAACMKALIPGEYFSEALFFSYTLREFLLNTGTQF